MVSPMLMPKQLAQTQIRLNSNKVKKEKEDNHLIFATLVPSKKKIDMDKEGGIHGDIINLSIINILLQKKKTEEAIVIDDDDITEGKLTLKVYKSEVVCVGGKNKFCVVVDLVNSVTKKSLWCNDGSVMTNVFETMSHQYAIEAFKKAAPINMHDVPGSSTT